MTTLEEAVLTALPYSTIPETEEAQAIIAIVREAIFKEIVEWARTHHGYDVGDTEFFHGVEQTAMRVLHPLRDSVRSRITTEADVPGWWDGPRHAYPDPPDRRTS